MMSENTGKTGTGNGAEREKRNLFICQSSMVWVDVLDVLIVEGG